MKSMKTLVAVVIAALTLCLTGCKKDYENLIVGSWEQTSMSLTVTSSQMDQPWSETWTPEEGERTVITFNNDNTVTVVETNHDETETTRGTYNVDGDKLTMTMDGETETFNIDKLDSKNLSISYSESGTEEGVTYTESMVVNFKKV